MPLRDRIRSARSALSPNSATRSTLHPSTSSSSTSTLSSSTSSSKMTDSSSSKASATSSNTSTSSSSSTSRLTLTHLFRSRRSHETTSSAADTWVDPPLKYSDPPQREYVELLAAWEWGSASGHVGGRSDYSVHDAGYGAGGWSRVGERGLGRAAGRVVIRRQSSWESCVSPGTTSRRGSAGWEWI